MVVQHTWRHTFKGFSQNSEIAENGSCSSSKKWQEKNEDKFVRHDWWVYHYLETSSLSKYLRFGKGNLSVTIWSGLIWRGRENAWHYTDFIVTSFECMNLGTHHLISGGAAGAVSMEFFEEQIICHVPPRKKHLLSCPTLERKKGEISASQ